MSAESRRYYYPTNQFLSEKIARVAGYRKFPRWRTVRLQWLLVGYWGLCWMCGSYHWLEKPQRLTLSYPRNPSKACQFWRYPPLQKYIFEKDFKKLSSELGLGVPFQLCLKYFWWLHWGWLVKEVKKEPCKLILFITRAVILQNLYTSIWYTQSISQQGVLV